MLFNKTPENVQKTERECSQCEDGMYYKYDDDLICGMCHYAPETRAQKSSLGTLGEWEQFWSHREEYSGWHNEDRIRFVGGFHGAYLYDD